MRTTSGGLGFVSNRFFDLTGAPGIDETVVAGSL